VLFAQPSALEWVRFSRYAEGQARRYIRSLPYKPHIPTEKIFPNANPLALSLLVRLLAFNPMKRITVEEALADPYLASLHDPSDEPLAHAAFSFDFEKMPLSKPSLKLLIAKEMLAFHPDCAWDADKAGAQQPPAEAQPSDAEMQPAPPLLSDAGALPPKPQADDAMDSPMHFD